jgi:hypothetical protein
MEIDIKIKANVNSISLSGIYGLLNMYYLEGHQVEGESVVLKFKGIDFKIETSISASINYVITEL